MRVTVVRAGAAVLLLLGAGLVGSSARARAALGWPCEPGVPRALRRSRAAEAAEAAPAFTWDPPCRVTELTVYRDDALVWSVGAPGPGFRPPVRYGVAPPGARTTGGPAPLEGGAGYAVSIGWEGEDTGVVTTPAPFTP